MRSVAESSLAAAGLFEAEVLTELLLWRWNHPRKEDAEFRNDLLEDAVGVLRRAVKGEQLIESVPADQMSLIAAIWYVEWAAVSGGGRDPDGARHRWLEHVRRSLPSCFCPSDDLPPM